VIANHAAKIKEIVRTFILSSVNVPGIDDADDLFETGIVNSLFAVQLMTFIEKTFGVSVTRDDLDIENFKSIVATSEFISKKNGRIPA
jgi:methoxymalonate biosynthesis acyl carrier protein